MSSEQYHEPVELLSERTRNLHRALVSLYEELEAVDWYQQRAEACTDAELKAVLLHNKNEEVEHAMLVLEWLRRHDESFAARMATYLGRSGPILAAEGQDEPPAREPAAAEPSLGIASLKGGA